MYTLRTINDPNDYANTRMIDAEFDRFEAREDLESNLREMEFANFYHGDLDQQE